MGLFNNVNKYIKQKIDEKKELDKIYNDAYKEEYKTQLVKKAKTDVANKLNPDKKKGIKPIFKQGLVDDKPDLGSWKIGCDE